MKQKQIQIIKNKQHWKRLQKSKVYKDLLLNITDKGYPWFVLKSKEGVVVVAVVPAWMVNNLASMYADYLGEAWIRMPKGVK